jgi:hypothetical protein
MNDEFDNSPGGCTREAFDALAQNAGITLWTGHGAQGGKLPAVTFPKTTAGHSAATDWLNAGLGSDDMEIITYSEYHAVVPSEDWFKANWEPYHDENDAIVVVNACHSDQIVLSMGGRVKAGWEGANDGLLTNSDISALFRYMNGLLGGTQFREATDAYSYGQSLYTPMMRWIHPSDLLPEFKLVAEGPTTLCPRVNIPNAVSTKTYNSDTQRWTYSYHFPIDTECEVADYVTETIMLLNGTYAVLPNTMILPGMFLQTGETSWGPGISVSQSLNGDEVALTISGLTAPDMGVPIIFNARRIQASNGGEQKADLSYAPNRDVSPVLLVPPP